MGDPPEKSPPRRVEAEAEFAAVLADATKQYRDSAGLSLEQFLTPTIRSVDDLMRQIDTQNEGFSSFREKRHNIFATLTVMLKPVEIVGELVSSAVSEVYPATQQVFSAVMFLINAAHNVSSTYDSILELFDQLKDFTARLEAYVQIKMSAALRAKVVSIMVSLFQVFVLATKEIRRGRFKAYFKNLIGSESPIQPALENLKKLTLGEERQVMADTLVGVSQLGTGVSNISSGVSTIGTGVSNLGITTSNIQSMVSEVNDNVQSLRSEYKERTTMAQQDKLKDILDPSPFPEDFYTSFTKARVEGTGDWLLEDVGIQSFLEGETRYVWVSGGPGSGKSYLATRLISWGVERLSHTAYFYFRANNPETRSVLQALRDIAYQLSESDAFYGKQIIKNLHSSDDIKTIPSAYRKLLQEPFENDNRGRRFHVFLDGIDEADSSEMEEFLQQLSPDEEEPEERSKIHLALVGRSYMSEVVASYLDPVEQNVQFSTILVTHDRNSEDVRAFIEHGIQHSRTLQRSSPDFKREVIETMIKRADGLFILAKFMLADVNRARRPASILKSLESYPREITGMLQRTLSDLAQTISDEEATDLNEMLMWVSSAEQALTLEQLEAILILRYDDPPFRFEETLRGQYACFFELERDDGLTTDDLIKDHERLFHRSRGSTPNSHSRSRRSSSAGKESPQRTLSPAQKLIGGRRRQTSPVAVLGTSPPQRAFSPSRSPVLRSLPFEAEQELEFRSNKATTFITLFHTSLREFFRDEDTTTSSTRGSSAPVLGFKPLEAKIHVLKTCLRIFTDKAWFESRKLTYRKRTIKQYAAWYWQEHLEMIDLASVSREDKKAIGAQLYHVLTDEDIIYQWTNLYEENNEGLEVLADGSIKLLRDWMADPDVLAGLPPSAQDWAREAVKSPVGIFEPIGRFYAKGWVDVKFEKYIPTDFCFKIVQTLAFMAAGKTWSDSQRHWSEIPVASRIEKATEWAGYPKDAHWYRRVGSSFLVAGMRDKALEYYDQALQMDGDSVETRGRKAFCLFRDEKYRDALELALECLSTEEKSIAEGKLSEEQLKLSKWRLYKDHFVIAECYYEEGEVESSLTFFRKAMLSSKEAKLRYSERFEALTAFLKVLSTENRHEEMMQVIENESMQATSTKQEQSRLVDFLLDQHNQSLVLEWIPKAACKANQVDFIIERIEMAMDAAHKMRHSLKELYLRLALGTTLMFNRDIEGAIRVFEQISLNEFRPRGNVPTRQAYAISFQRLAALYKQQVLHAGVNSKDAERWIDRLEVIMTRQSAQQNLDMPASLLGSDINSAAIYLSLFYRLRGKTEAATQLLGALIIESCEILEDDDLRNDEFALENLLQLFTAGDDMANAIALAVSMRRLSPEASYHTPTDSPVETRSHPEPKLQDIQSSNRSCGQCLDTIPDREAFVFCRFCLEAFCRRCLKNVIKKADNVGPDKSFGVVCRADHDWLEIPPMSRVLHTGQMLFSNGEVREFAEWKEAIKKQWENRAKGTKTLKG